jgi:hypothetical protein
MTSTLLPFCADHATQVSRIKKELDAYDLSMLATIEITF